MTAAASATLDAQGPPIHPAANATTVFETLDLVPR